MLIQFLQLCFLKLLPPGAARKRIQKQIYVNVHQHQFQRKKQILVDISVIYKKDAGTGIQRVVRSVLSELERNQPADYEIKTVFATTKCNYQYAQQNSKDRKPIKIVPGDIFLGLDLSAHILPKHIQQIYGWKRSGANIHIIVYDLLPLKKPDWFNQKTSEVFRKWIRFVAIYTDSAICISKTVKNDLDELLRKKYNISSDSLPTNTFPLGYELNIGTSSQGLPENFNNEINTYRSIPTILMVGTIEPRKGYDQVIEAFELLWERHADAPQLLIVGKPGWKTERLQQRMLSSKSYGHKLFWLQNASDEYLSYLYPAAKGIIAASYGEGFGLPVLEAAAYDKPILARNIDSFLEIKVPRLSYFIHTNSTQFSKDIYSWFKKIDKTEEIFTEKKISDWATGTKKLLELITK